MSLVYFGKISNILNKTYNIDSTSTLYIPYGKDKVQYELTLAIKNNQGNLIITPVQLEQVYLFNKKTGSRYTIKEPGISFSHITNKVLFTLDAETYEDSSADSIVLKLIVEGSEVYIKKDITLKYIKNSSKLFNYTLGTVEAKDSNLLTRRAKIGFPKWGTIHKNENSVALKIQEPILAHVHGTLSKINQYLKLNYSRFNVNEKYQRIFIKDYPKNIIRTNLDNSVTELIETDNIFSSLRRVSLKNNNEGLKLVTVLLDPLKNNEEYLSYINTNILSRGLTVYLKSLNGLPSHLVFCTVEGLLETGEEVVETIVLRSHNYMTLANKFKSIFNISCPQTIEVTNYVDLRYNHFIESEPYVKPLISNNQYLSFNPVVESKVNSEYTDNFILLSDTLSEGGGNLFQFSVKDRLNSFVIDEEFNIVYLSENNGKQFLNYSKLNIDYTKPFINPTINNNEFIEVSDTSTAIGDWVDVSVHLSKYRDKYDSKSLYLEVRNQDSVYYYDYNLNTLVPEKSFLYLDLIPSDIIEFTIFVNNSDPYIFSLIDETKNVTLSAMTDTLEIKPLYTEEISTTTDPKNLIMYNDEIRLVNDTSPLIVIDEEQEKDVLTLILENSNSSFVNYLLKLNNDTLTNKTSSMEKSYYYTYEINEKGIRVFNFNINKLKYRYGNSLTLFIGALQDVTSTLLPVPGSEFEGSFTETSTVFSLLYNGEMLVQENLNPKFGSNEANLTEYVIDINLNSVSSLVVREDESYDI